MKRTFFVIILVLSLVFVGSFSAFAFMPKVWSDNTDVKTGDAVLVTGPGFFYGIVVMTDGTNPVTVKLYKNTVASGVRLFPDWEVTTSSTNRAQTLSIDPPVPFDIGVYCDVTTGGTVSYMGFYRKQ